MMSCKKGLPGSIRDTRDSSVHMQSCDCMARYSSVPSCRRERGVGEGRRGRGRRGEWGAGSPYQKDDSSRDPVPHELALPSSPKPQVARQSLCSFVSSKGPGLTALTPSEMPPPTPISRQSRLPAAPSGPVSYLPKARRVLVSIPRAARSPSRTPMRTTLEAAPEGPTAPPRCAHCAAGPGAPFWRARVREESRRVGDFRSRCRPRQIRMQRLLLEPREASHGGLRAASSWPAAGGCLGAQHHPSASAVGPYLCCRALF